MTTVNKLMIGVAVGAILGVLYAPDKGSITRRKLSRTGNDLRERFNDLKDAVTERIDCLKEDVEDKVYQEVKLAESEASVKPHSWQ